jgi:hypothetical protein
MYWGRPPPVSLGLATCDTDLDSSGCHLRVFLLADEINLGRADVGVAGKLAHLVQSTVTMHLR